MTIPAGVVIRNRYVITDPEPSGTGTYPYTFKIFEEDDLGVYRVVDGESTKLTLNSHYTVTGAGSESGGNVVLDPDGPDNAILIIVGEYDYEQETDYVENDPFPAQVHENAMDKLTLLQIVNKDAVDRSVTANVADPTDQELELPYYTERASKFLAFDATGQTLLMSAGTGNTATTYMNNMLTAGTNEATFKAYANLTTTAYTVALLSKANESAVKSYLNLEPDVDYQPYSTYLDAVDNTPANVRTNLELAHLGGDNLWTDNQLYDDGTLSYSGSDVTWDVSVAQNAVLTLTKDTTIYASNIPTNTGYFTLMLIQDGTGGWTVTFDSDFYWSDGAAPIVSDAAGAVDIVGCYAKGGALYSTIAQNFS